MTLFIMRVDHHLHDPLIVYGNRRNAVGAPVPISHPFILLDLAELRNPGVGRPVEAIFLT